MNANSRQPQKTPPDTDTDTQNYNTFSQPEFAQPSQMAELSMGHSLMGQPFANQPDSRIDISEIQAQLSSVMTQYDASQMLGPKWLRYTIKKFRN